MGICYKFKKKKKHDKAPEKKNFNEMELSILLDKKFKVIVIKMFTDLGRRMVE